MTRQNSEKVTNAGLRSDGELVQARADTFEFTTPDQASGWGASATLLRGRTVEVDVVDDDDDGLPDTIIWCIDGNGTGESPTAPRDPIMLAYDLQDHEWSLNGGDARHEAWSDLVSL
jgi:hypothetical protein